MNHARAWMSMLLLAISTLIGASFSLPAPAAEELRIGFIAPKTGIFAQLGTDVFASAGFAANIALLLQSGYFDVESAKKPLLHLWSLGIEEQFYLVAPLILVLARRKRALCCSSSPCRPG